MKLLLDMNLSQIDIFNRLFARYLDLAVLPHDHHEQRRRDHERLLALAEEKSIAEEVRRMMPWYRRLTLADAASEALEAGDVILDSAHEALPQPIKAAYEVIKELSGFAQRGLALYKAGE